MRALLSLSLPLLIAGVLMQPAYANSTLLQQLTQAEFHDATFQKAEQEAIARATQAWADALNKHDVFKICALYDRSFILYATFASKINTTEALFEYFNQLMKKPDLKVTFTEQSIRTYGATAINSGLYTFSYREQGKVHHVDARYTFVYALDADTNWRIVDHHSSVLPE